MSERHDCAHSSRLATVTTSYCPGSFTGNAAKPQTEGIGFGELDGLGVAVGVDTGVEMGAMTGVEITIAGEELGITADDDLTATGVELIALGVELAIGTGVELAALEDGKGVDELAEDEATE